MKKFILIILVAALVPLIPAWAHDESSSSDSTPKASHQRDEQQREVARQRLEDAQAKLEQRRQEFAAKQAELKAQAAEKRHESCQRRLDGLNGRLSNSDKQKKGLLTHYTKAQEHIQRLIDRGKTAGVDTSKLEADLVVYNTKVDTLSADFDAFISQLVSAQGLSCDEAKDELKTVRGQIQAAHQKVVNDRKAIHQFYTSTLRPDIVTAIKAIAAKKEPAEKSTP